MTMQRASVAYAIISAVVLASAAAALAHGDEAGASRTITGEVVDLACYLGHGAAGASHQACAQKCIASGLPVGIKSGDTVYLAVDSEHGSANAALAPLAGRSVTAEGTVSERDGLHLIAIKRVTAKS